MLEPTEPCKWTCWFHIVYYGFFVLFFFFFFLFFGSLHCTLVHTSETIKHLCYYSIFSYVIQLPNKMTIYSFILLSSELPVYFYLTVSVYSLLIYATLHETVLHSLCCVLLNSELHQINVGHVVAQLVEALRYKLEGCRFNSRRGQCNFSLASSFWLHYGPGVNSTSNRKGKCGQCVWLTNLPPSCAECTEMRELQPTATLRACPGLYNDCFIILNYSSN